MSSTEERTRTCRRLRNKGMFIEVEPDPHVPNPDDGFCWCTHTLNCLGPDGNPVDKEECKPGRDCYEQ